MTHLSPGREPWRRCESLPELVFTDFGTALDLSCQHECHTLTDRSLNHWPRKRPLPDPLGDEARAVYMVVNRYGNVATSVKPAHKQSGKCTCHSPWAAYE